MTGSPQGRKRRQYSTTLRQVDLDRFIALLIFFIHIASLRQGVAFASSVSRAQQQQQQNRERDLFSHPSGRGEIRRQKKPPRSLLQMVSPFLFLDDDDDDCCCCSFSKQNERRRRRRRKEGIPKLTILKKKKERTGRGKGKEKSLVK